MAAGAVAAAGSGGLAASLTSGAGEADGNKTLCCMALTLLRVGQRRGGQRGKGNVSRKQGQHKSHATAMETVTGSATCQPRNRKKRDARE